jgi:plastocyanin
VKDRSGKVIAEKDIPRRQAITVEVALAAAGIYPFYCDKPLRAALGMKGRIEAE